MGEGPAPGHQGLPHRLRGPSRALGYWQQLDKSQACFRGEWVVTGVVEVDEEGGRVYFINTQKLAVNQPLTNRGETRVEKSATILPNAGANESRPSPESHR